MQLGLKTVDMTTPKITSITEEHQIFSFALETDITILFNKGLLEGFLVIELLGLDGKGLEGVITVVVD